MRLLLRLIVGVLLLPAAAHADVLITISKASQQMDVSVDGRPAYHWTVSTGRAGYATPSGSFRAIRLERVYFSKKFDDAPMPNAVFFHGGYAIHGTMEERRLGTPASHGCVRLARENAAALFGLVRQYGMQRTRVVVVDGALPGYRDAPVARLAPGQRFDDRDWRARGFSRGFAGRAPDLRYRRAVRARRSWREAPPARMVRMPAYYVYRARPAMRTVVVVRRPARYSGFDW